jgi:hypothetical protein
MEHKGDTPGWYGGTRNDKFFLVHDWGEAHVVSGATLLDKPHWPEHWDALLLADVADVVENHPDLVKGIQRDMTALSRLNRQQERNIALERGISQQISKYF